MERLRTAAIDADATTEVPSLPNADLSGLRAVSMNAASPRRSQRVRRGVGVVLVVATVVGLATWLLRDHPTDTVATSPEPSVARVPAAEPTPVATSPATRALSSESSADGGVPVSVVPSAPSAASNAVAPPRDRRPTHATSRPHPTPTARTPAAPTASPPRPAPTEKVPVAGKPFQSL